MQRFQKALAMPFVLALLLVAGCGSDDESEPAANAGAAGSGEEAALPIKVPQYAEINPNVWFAEATEVLGLYEKNGLDADVVKTPANNAPPLLFGKRIDVMCSLPFFFNALKEKQDVVSVVGIGLSAPYSFVSAPAIKTEEDLKGKSIGVTAIGASGTYFNAVAHLEEKGIAEDEVKFRVLADPTLRLTSMKAGRLDAAIVPTSLVPRAREMGLNVLLEDAGSLYPERPWFLCYALKEYADAHEEELNRFAAAIIEVQRKLHDDEEAFLEVNRETTDGAFTDDEARDLFEVLQNSHFYAVNGGLDEADMQASLDAYKEALGDEPFDVELADFYRPQYVEAALDKLGVVESEVDPASWYTSK